MKNTLLQILVIFFGLGVTSTSLAEGNEFQFRFEMTVAKDLTTRQPIQNRFDYVTRASTWESAFQIAAQACYRHFKNGQPLTEDQGLDIIDVCANPRRI